MAEFAVVLRFDLVTEENLKDLQETLWLSGIKPESEISYLRPHVTLVGLKGIALVELAEHLQAFVKDEVCLNVELDAVGTFPRSERVVYIAPVVTSQLLEFHKKLLGRLSGRAVLLRDHYKEGHWIPHCTVALYIPEAQIPAAIGLCRKSDVFGPAKLVEIALVEFPSAEEVGVYALT